MIVPPGSAAPRLTVVIPGDLETRTGGYGYDRRVVAGLRERGWAVELLSLDHSFPLPTMAARAHAAKALAALPGGATVLIDGLALGALADEAARESARLRIIALVHHPLAAETGLDSGVAASLEDSERRALGSVRFVVVTGRATGAALAHYGVGPERIAVIEPGTDRAPLARGSAQTSASGPTEVALLCVGTLTPRKGHELLFRALASLPHRQWRLTCAGSLDRDRRTVERLRAQLAADGIEDRVDLVGDLDTGRLAEYYDRADLFVLATLYEGYGMAVAEALARGLPVVSTATGSISELLTGGAGMAVAPGDLAAFTTALARVVGDPALRQRLAKGARRVRDRLPSWDDAVGAIERVLDRGQCPPPNSDTELRHQTPTPANSDTELRHRTPTPANSDTKLRHRTPTPEFSADWLALREPADRAARSTRLTREVADRFAPGSALGILDLGAGTGANMRYLASYLPAGQRWLLVDHDAALLALLAARDDGRCTVETRELDLQQLVGDDERHLFSGRGLVTASALLDLVSEQWLRALAGRCRETGAALLFALSYDGVIRFSPDEPEDAEVRGLVNQHQRTDKGFGPALGSGAAAAAESVLAGAGYRVDRERSDWVLDAGSQGLQRQLIDGWAMAAAEVAPRRAASIGGWRNRRVAHIAANRSHLVVGHEDIAAWIR